MTFSHGFVTDSPSSAQPDGATPPIPNDPGPAVRTNAVVAVLAFAGVVAAVMQTLVVPLIGELPELLDTTRSNATWVVTATLLAAAVATPISGRLGDLYGKRRIMLGCSALLIQPFIVTTPGRWTRRGGTSTWADASVCSRCAAGDCGAPSTGCWSRRWTSPAPDPGSPATSRTWRCGWPPRQTSPPWRRSTASPGAPSARSAAGSSPTNSTSTDSRIWSRSGWTRFRGAATTST
ncbi:possible transporter, MFS superfamily protein (plasmid) [Rhodococcus jostii RHA1]|uniref:Possible transporter, MFS superfamily protein n=2 Tax=Rhodococcus TaxID=1827 RepID=Q0RZJ9_RHOJR|nr:possible transporter, MFS superfamily protein [Rhodococcus jostii RHA1]EID80138.1 major facilitator transporter [Rhodococcus opacus RKJ300 = JCM 13270]QQZ18532.1 MFS transporter [Rhodococcus sp. 21391]